MRREETARVWRARLARFRRQGSTVAEFCRAEGVGKSAFYYWYSRVPAEEVEPAVEFVEVDNGARPVVGDSGVVIEVAGVLVRVCHGFDQEVLQAVVLALTGAA